MMRPFLAGFSAFFSRPLQAEGLRFDGGGSGWGWPISTATTETGVASPPSPARGEDEFKLARRSSPAACRPKACELRGADRGRDDNASPEARA